MFWVVVLGSIGLGYTIYGRKQSAGLVFVCGLMLMFFPYFVSSPLALAAIGGALIAAPFIIRP